MAIKLGAMFGDIFRSLFKAPVTVKYPFEPSPAPENYRGKLVWDPAKCTGCQLCVKDCPSNAIELVVLDKVNKRFVMRYHIDRCTYCAQCVENCRFKCIEMSNEQWELAALKKEPFTVYYGKEEDVAELLAKFAGSGIDAAEGVRKAPAPGDPGRGQ
jgi:formate hydrogenlyase subunit 6/NADH:ubiquinone oxidoreductase subunit I